MIQCIRMRFVTKVTFNRLLDIYFYMMPIKMKSLFPITDWIQAYNKIKLKGDLVAGLTVGIMLIPQGMAYAMLAGLPPVYGLYASLIPQVVYALMGTSRQLSVAPVAMDSLLVASGLSAIAAIGSEQYIALAIMLAFMMGVLQLAFGILKLGFLVNFLSKPVISGFTSAAALIIGLNQLKHLTGANIPRSNHIHELLYQTVIHFTEIHWISLSMGLLSITTIIAIKRLKLKIPGALAVVVLGTLAVTFFDLQNTGVKIVGDIPKGLPSFSLDVFDYSQFSSLLPTAITLSIIAFMEAISVAKAIEEKHDDYKVNSNQELIANGSANILGALFSAYPVTGGFSRTAVNDQAGAKTGIASIIAASVIALTLLFLTPLFYNLPNVVLAAIIIVAVFGLIDLKYPVQLWKMRKDEFLMLFLTFVVTISVGIKEGILAGMAISILLLVYRTSYPHIAEIGLVKNTKAFKNIQRFPDAETRPDVLCIRFDAQLFFANVSYFKEKVEEKLSRKPSVRLIVLNAEAINHIDSSAVFMLEAFIKDLKSKGIEFYVAGAIGPARDIIFASGLIELIGEKALFVRTYDALDYFDKHDQEDNYELRFIAIQKKSHM